MKKLDQKLQKVNVEVSKQKEASKNEQQNKFKKAFEQMKIEGYEEQQQQIINKGPTIQNQQLQSKEQEVNTDEKEMNRFGKFGQSSNNERTAEMVLSQIYDRGQLDQRILKKVDELIEQSTFQIEKDIQKGDLEVSSVCQEVIDKEQQKQQQKCYEELLYYNNKINEVYQKRNEVEQQIEAMNSELSYLHNQSQLVSQKQHRKKEVTEEEKEIFRQKVIQLERERKALEKRRIKQNDEFYKKVEENQNQIIKQQRIESQQFLEKKVREAQDGIKKIQERAQLREQKLSVFKKAPLDVRVSLLDEQKERLKRVRDLKGQRVSIEEIKDFYNKQLQLEKQFEEKRKNKIDKIKELKKLPVYESQYYKDKQSEYLEDVQNKKERKRDQKEKVDRLLYEIKQKPISIDQKKVDELKDLNDQEQIDMKNKRRLKVVRDKDYHIIDKHYVIPKEIEKTEWQKEVYKQGQEYLDYQNKLPKKKKNDQQQQTDQNIVQSLNQMSTGQNTYQSAVQSEKVFKKFNYLQDEKVKKSLAYNDQLEKLQKGALQEKDEIVRLEQFREQIKQVEEKAVRCEKQSEISQKPSFHGKHKIKSSYDTKDHLSDKIDESNQLYLSSIKAKLAFMQNKL